MSEPRTDYQDKKAGAISELISAMSALNMAPEPIENPKGDYLSERDKWAKHALEHIAAAIDLLR